VAEEKLSDIVFPEFGGELSWSGIGVDGTGFESGGDKPETSVSIPSPKAAGGSKAVPFQSC